MPLKELLDPQGKTVSKNLKNVHIETISDVRIGKHIELIVETKNKREAQKQVDLACKKLLANPIMESYTFELERI